MVAVMMDIDGAQKRAEREERDEEARRRFGKFLQENRRRYYSSQDDVAHVLGMSQSHVSKWERGEVVGFTAGDLRAWSDALQIPMLRLLREAGFLTDIDIAQVDPDLYVNPYVQMLADALPPLGSEDDVELIADLAWAAKNWAIRRGAPPVERGRGQTVPVEMPEAAAAGGPASGGDLLSVPGRRVIPGR